MGMWFRVALLRLDKSCCIHNLQCFICRSHDHAESDSLCGSYFPIRCLVVDRVLSPHAVFVHALLSALALHVRQQMT